MIVSSHYGEVFASNRVRVGVRLGLGPALALNLRDSEGNLSMEQYDNEMEKFKTFVFTKQGGRHTLICDIVNHKYVNLNVIKKYCKKMDKREKDVDLESINLIRSLFILEDVLKMKNSTVGASDRALMTVSTTESIGLSPNSAAMSDHSEADKFIFDSMIGAEHHALADNADNIAGITKDTSEVDTDARIDNFNAGFVSVGKEDPDFPDNNASNNPAIDFYAVPYAVNHDTTPRDDDKYFKDVEVAIQLIVKSFANFPFWPHKRAHCAGNNWSRMSHQVINYGRIPVQFDGIYLLYIYIYVNAESISFIEIWVD